MLQTTQTERKHDVWLCGRQTAFTVNVAGAFSAVINLNPRPLPAFRPIRLLNMASCLADRLVNEASGS